jgi:hypothetical protein
MFRELYGQVLAQSVPDPNQRSFLGKVNLKRIMKGNLWSESVGIQEGKKNRIKCIITNRVLESKEEYEAFLDASFRQEVANRKLERWVLVDSNNRKISLGFLTKNSFLTYVETGVAPNEKDLEETKQKKKEFLSYVLLPEEFKFKSSEVGLI